MQEQLAGWCLIWPFLRGLKNAAAYCQKSQLLESYAVLTIFLGLQLGSCRQSSNLQEMLGLGRDLEILFECSSTVWVASGNSNDTYSLLFPALFGLSLWSQKTWLNCTSSQQPATPVGTNGAEPANVGRAEQWIYACCIILQTLFNLHVESLFQV